MTEREVEILFNREKERFSDFFPVHDLSLKVHNLFNTPGCSSYRDIAWADPNSRTVNICKRVLDFHNNNIIALIRHEISHLCDPFCQTERAEQRADDIAYLVTGHRINYSGPYLIQTVSPGIHPRPKQLHS